MKTRSLLTAMLLVIMSLPLFAQDCMTQEEKVDMHVKMLTKKLSLTEEQAAQVKEKLLVFAPRMEALHKAHDGDFKAMHEDMKALMDEQKAAIKTVLTEEQAKQMDEMMAQHGGPHGKHHGPPHGHRPPHGGNQDMKGMHQNPEMKKEMKAFFAENVLPLMKEQRLKFDNELSDEEKQQIMAARAMQKQHHEKMMEKKGEMNGHHAKGEKGHQCDGKCDGEKCQGHADRQKPTEEQQEAWKKRKEEHQSVMAPIKAIVDNHRTSIDQLFAEIETQQATWQSGLEGILTKYAPEDEDAPSPETIACMMMKRHLSPRHFVMMDPNASFDLQLEENEPNVSVFPNPANGQSKVTFEVKEEGNVTIDLLDRSGNLVKRLKEEKMATGTFDLNVPLQDLSNNSTYYIRYTDATGSVTKKLVVVQ